MTSLLFFFAFNKWNKPNGNSFPFAFCNASENDDQSLISVVSDLVGEVRSLSARVESKTDAAISQTSTGGPAHGLLGNPLGSVGGYGPSFDSAAGFLGKTQLAHGNAPRNRPALTAITEILKAESLHDLYQIDELVAEEREYYTPQEENTIDRMLKSLRDSLEP